MSAADMAVRAEGCVGTSLNEAVFQHVLALFEDLLFELLRLGLSADPGGAPNKAEGPVSLAMVIDAPDREAILRFVIDRELNVLEYERPRAWFRSLNDRVGRLCPTDEQIERSTGIRASLEIPAQNRGAVNPTYLDKADRHARDQLGQRLGTPEPDLHDTWLMIQGRVQDIATAAISKA